MKSFSYSKSGRKQLQQMTKGELLKDSSSNTFIPPKDTGEAAGLSPSNLTITFGVGPDFFQKDGKDRFGLKAKQPEELRDLPAFPLDALEDAGAEAIFVYRRVLMIFKWPFMLYGT